MVKNRYPLISLKILCSTLNFIMNGSYFSTTEKHCTYEYENNYVTMIRQYKILQIQRYQKKYIFKNMYPLHLQKIFFELMCFQERNFEKKKKNVLNIMVGQKRLRKKEYGILNI